MIYTDEYIDKINSLISQEGEMISIDTRHLGLYKSERWKFQNESRFKIIVMPKNNNYVNVPNQASDLKRIVSDTVVTTSNLKKFSEKLNKRFLLFRLLF